VAKVCDAITQTSEKLKGLTEVFSPCATENTPGNCLMDKYPSRVQFDGFDPKEEGAYAKRQSHLNAVFAEAKNSPGTVCCGTDCSVPMCTMHQASAAYVIKQPGNQPLVSGWVAERVLSLDAELFAIRSAVVRATTLNNCGHIIVFTNSLTSARRAVDPYARALNKWLAASADNHIEFIQAPSKLEWGIHHEAHLHARSLPPIPSGRRPATSLDSVCKRVMQSALDAWHTMFQDPNYRGHHFLALTEPKGTTIQPVYTNGGAWLKSVSQDNKLCACMCHAILDHAPIGDYYCRFNIPEEYSCVCGAATQLHEHIFERCPDLNTNQRSPKLLNELLGYLE
jgi:hypothetical protein